MATAEANSIRHGPASEGTRVLAAELRRGGLPNLKGRRGLMALREGRRGTSYSHILLLLILHEAHGGDGTKVPIQ
jgi:hypothetical protein